MGLCVDVLPQTSSKINFIKINSIKKIKINRHEYNTGAIFIQTLEQIAPIYKILTDVNLLCFQTTQSNTRRHQLTSTHSFTNYNAKRQRENFIVKWKFEWADENLVNSMQQNVQWNPEQKGRGRKRKKNYLKSYFLISWMKASYVTVQLQPALVTWFT